MKKMYILPFLLLLLVFVACTYTISMVHTEGAASDVIDQEEIPTATLSPNIDTK